MSLAFAVSFYILTLHAQHIYRSATDTRRAIFATSPLPPTPPTYSPMDSNRPKARHRARRNLANGPEQVAANSRNTFFLAPPDKALHEYLLRKLQYLGPDWLWRYRDDTPSREHEEECMLARMRLLKYAEEHKDDLGVYLRKFSSLRGAKEFHAGMRRKEGVEVKFSSLEEIFDTSGSFHSNVAVKFRMPAPLADADVMDKENTDSTLQKESSTPAISKNFSHSKSRPVVSQIKPHQAALGDVAHLTELNGVARNPSTSSHVTLQCLPSQTRIDSNLVRKSQDIKSLPPKNFGSDALIDFLAARDRNRANIHGGCKPSIGSYTRNWFKSANTVAALHSGLVVSTFKLNNTNSSALPSAFLPSKENVPIDPEGGTEQGTRPSIVNTNRHVSRPAHPKLVSPASPPASPSRLPASEQKSNSVACVREQPGNIGNPTTFNLISRWRASRNFSGASSPSVNRDGEVQDFRQEAGKKTGTNNTGIPVPPNSSASVEDLDFLGDYLLSDQPSTTGSLNEGRSRQHNWPFAAYERQYEGPAISIIFDSHKPSFDIHNSVLHSESPLFATGNTVTLGTSTKLISLNTGYITKKDFAILINWIYSNQKLPTSFYKLVDLYDVAATLAMWKRQNAIVQRITDVVRADQNLEIDINLVQYAHGYTTPASTPMRQFIVALFCQRGQVSPLMSLPLPVWRDIVSFQRVLARVRAKNPTGVEGYDLEKHFRIYQPRDPSLDHQAAEPHAFGTQVTNFKGRLRWIVTRGKAVDYTRIRYPLPEELVFDAYWTREPGSFFVSRKQAWQNAEFVRKQLGLEELEELEVMEDD